MNRRQSLFLVVLTALVVAGLWAATAMMRDPANIPHSAAEKAQNEGR